jgi:hypothetical protein
VSGGLATARGLFPAADCDDKRKHESRSLLVLVRAFLGVQPTAGHCWSIVSPPIGFTAKGVSWPVSRLVCTLGDRPVFRLFRVGVIPSCLAGLFEVPSLASVDAVSVNVRRPSYILICWGSCPLRDLTGSVHTRGGSHLSASFRPRAFAAPRRLSPLSAPRASFIPLPRPGFLTVQGFLPLRSPHGSSPLGAPVPFPPARSPSDCSFGCHARAPRLRGLDPRTGAFICGGV